MTKEKFKKLCSKYKIKLEDLPAFPRKMTDKQWEGLLKCIYEFSLKTTKFCNTCYGKGYATVLKGDTFCLADFIGDKTYRTRKAGIRINFCSCGRGRDLQIFFTLKKKFKP